MTLTDNNKQKALKIKDAVNEYFENSNDTKVQAKELMNLFISKGIFSSNSSDGLPIRRFLRFLYDNKQLSLIPQALFEQKAKMYGRTRKINRQMVMELFCPTH